jgi:hypothetical protein
MIMVTSSLSQQDDERLKASSASASNQHRKQQELKAGRLMLIIHTEIRIKSQERTRH